MSNQQDSNQQGFYSFFGGGIPRYLQVVSFNSTPIYISYPSDNPKLVIILFSKFQTTVLKVTSNVTRAELMSILKV